MVRAKFLIHVAGSSRAVTFNQNSPPAFLVLGHQMTAG
jgi:hypothetical protein